MSNNRLRSFVEEHLLDGQSPEGISGRLKYREKSLPYVSKDVIYTYLKSPYGKIIGLTLKKKKHFVKRKKTTQLKDRMFIEKRGRIGDMEGDFIVSGRSGKGMLLVVQDRKSRNVLLEPIYDVSVDNAHKGLLKIKRRFPEMRTLTLDNDILFKAHKTLGELLSIKIYFCHPYSSWEKGGIENANRYIRKFIPKGSDISQFDKDHIKLIESRCNERFMQCLKYETPAEVLNKYRKKPKRKQKTAS